MKLTIHRGTREIGGNCIEIQSRGRRIFFDLGIPLVNPGGGRFSPGGGNGIPHPSAGFRNIRVFYPLSLCRRLDRIGRRDIMDMFRRFRITPEQLSENPSKHAMMMRSSMVRDIGRIQALEGATVIYSLWKGYLEEESMKAMLEFMAGHRMQLVEIHTSGHADIRTLQRVVREHKPRKIVPVHTFQPDRFHELFDNVLSVSDGEEITV